MPPNRDALEAILRGCGVALAPGQLDQLWAYHRLLRRADETLNLTRIRNFENMVLKHYVDSLLVLNYVELPSPLIDMGSGPGLPGIPLKIARPEVEMVLAEPRGTRAKFLEETCRSLGLKGVEVVARKVGPKLPYRVRGVITRAVASIPETLERVAECLVDDGLMIFMKGPDCNDEIAAAAKEHAGSFRLESDHAYSIPGTPHRRRLVAYRKIGARAAGGQSGSEGFKVHAHEITSASNPFFKQARELLDGRWIRKQGLALIAGKRIVDEVLARFREHVEGWLTDTKGEPPPHSFGSTEAPLPWHRLADALFRELDAAGTRSPLLLVRVPAMPAFRPDDPWPLGCTLFVPLQDPENVGAVIRSAAAFGVARVVLLKEAAHPFHPRAGRAAGPALFQVPMLLGPSLRELATAEDVPLIALDADAPPLESAPFPERFGLVIGLEGPGLPDALRAGARRSIPIAPGVESLNAAAATAVALYAWRRQSPLPRSDRPAAPTN